MTRLPECRIKLASGREITVSAPTAPERDPVTGELHIYGGEPAAVVSSIPPEGWLWKASSVQRRSGWISAGSRVMASVKRMKLKVRSGITQHPSGLTIRNADLKRARSTECAWDRRILAGYLNMLIGEEGIGKGNLIAWLAARLTRGELPGDFYGRPRPVVFVGDEDDWDDIWTPRLEAAGADLKLTHQIMLGKHGEVIDIRKDAHTLVAYIRLERPAVMYFDQLLDNLGATDTWKEKQVRDAIAPIRGLARTTDCALLATMHPNKREGEFRNRVSGTPAFNALSRSSLFLGRHPDDKECVVVVRPKNNYLGRPPAFEFGIEEQELVVNGAVIKTSRIMGMHESELQFDDLVKAEHGRRVTQQDQAKKLLGEMFSNGEVRQAKEVLERLKAEGFSENTVQAARRSLKIQTWQEQKFQGAWLWGHQQPKIVVKRTKSQ